MSPTQQKSYRVYIKGLAEGTLVVDLLSFFDGCGLIRNIVIRGSCGIVYFYHHEDADRAIYQLNGRFFQGRRVALRWFYTWKPTWKRKTNPQQQYLTYLNY